MPKLIAKIKLPALIFCFLVASTGYTQGNIKEIYKTVGIISYNNKVCSATLISHNAIITSRLCLQEKNIKANEITFEIIDPSSNFKLKVTGVAFIGSNQFIFNNINQSWALVQLSSPVPNIFNPVRISNQKINSNFKNKKVTVVGFLKEQNKLNFSIDNKCFFNKTDLARNDEQEYESIVVQSCEKDATMLLDGAAVFEENKNGEIALIGIKSGAIADSKKSISFNLIVPVRQSYEILKNLKQKNSKEFNKNLSSPIKGVEI